MQAVAADLGIEARIRVWVDSSAAKAMASRTGLGKTRHVEVRFLWVQEALRGKRLEILKIGGRENPADIATKPNGLSDTASRLAEVGARVVRRTSSSEAAS